MKDRCCPRCLTLTGDLEDGATHTCSPTEAWREMEDRVAELEAGIAELKARIAAILGTEGQPTQQQV
jgi:uncharacterized protein YceH (UPF0502 family)